MRTITATHLKTHCLSILDEVARTGEGVTILKRGRPVAQLQPPAVESTTPAQLRLRGTGRILGDILAPILPPEAWDAVRGVMPEDRGT